MKKSSVDEMMARVNEDNITNAQSELSLSTK